MSNKPVFVPGNKATPFKVANLNELKALIKAGNVPKAAKNVGGNTILVFLSGFNLYMDGSMALRSLLFTSYGLDP